VVEVIRPFNGKWPRIHPEAYVDSQAVVIGDVVVEEGASIWPCAVIRGDLSKVVVGRYTAIEDGVLIHGGGDPAKEPIKPVPVIIGEHCTIGHGAILHSCTIESYVLVGMNAVIHTEAVVGEGSIVAMGSVVEKGARIPPKTLVAGVPARPIKQLGDEVYEHQRRRTLFYKSLADKHKEALRLGSEAP